MFGHARRKSGNKRSGLAVEQVGIQLGWNSTTLAGVKTSSPLADIHGHKLGVRPNGHQDIATSAWQETLFISLHGETRAYRASKERRYDFLAADGQQSKYQTTKETSSFHPMTTCHLFCRHLELHLRDRHSGVEALGACPCAVEDGVAAVHAQVVLHLLLALLLVAVLFVVSPSALASREG